MPKRFKLQDLQRTQVSRETQVSDSFVPMTVDAPRLPALVDFSGVARNIGVYTRAKKAKDEEEAANGTKAWFAGRDRIFEQVTDEYRKAGAGKEGDDLAKAQLKVTVDLQKRNILPAQANPEWVNNIAKLEAAKLRGEKRRRLDVESARLSQIADAESDGRIDLEDANEVYASINQEMLEDALFAQLPDSLDEFLSTDEEEKARFLGKVQEGRMVEEEKRALDLEKQSLADGDPLGTPNRFAGFREAADLTGQDAEDFLASAKTKLTDMADRIPHSKDVLVESALEQVESFRLSGDTRKASSLLSVIAEMETGPGVQLQDDVAFQGAYLSMVEAIEEADSKDYLQQQRALSEHEGVGRSTVRGYMNAALAEGLTGEAAIQEAIKNTLADERFNNSLRDSKSDAPTKGVIGSWREIAGDVAVSSGAAKDARDSDTLEQLRYKLAVGEIDKEYALVAGEHHNLGPKFMQALAEDTTSEVVDEFRQTYLGTADKRVRDKNTKLEGASQAQLDSLEELAAETDAAKAAILVEGKAAGKTYKEITESSEYKEQTRILADDRALKAAKVTKAREDLDDALVRRDFGDIQKYAEAGKGILPDSILRAAKSNAAAQEKEFNDRLFASDEVEDILHDVEDAVEVALLASGVEEGDAVRLGTSSSRRKKLRSILRSRSGEISSLPYNQQAAKRTEIYNEAYETVLADILTDDTRAFIDSGADDKGLAALSEAQESRGKLRAYIGGGTVEGLLAGDVLQVASLRDSSVHEKFSGTTPDWFVARKQSVDVGRAHYDLLVSGDAVDTEVADKALLKQQAFTGRYGPDALAQPTLTITSLPPRRTFGPSGVTGLLDPGFDPSRDTEELKRMTDNGWKLVQVARAQDGDVPQYIFTKEVENTLNPYEVLPFRGDSKISGITAMNNWFEATSDEDRLSWYNTVGRKASSLAKLDDDLKKDVRGLLNRIQQ